MAGDLGSEPVRASTAPRLLADGVTPIGFEDARQDKSGPSKPIRFLPRGNLYLVDNSRLKSDRKGVQYRISMNWADKDRDCKPAEYGSVLFGIPENEDWVRIGTRYLPFKIEGIPILIVQERKDEIDRPLPAPDAAQPRTRTTPEEAAALVQKEPIPAPQDLYSPRRDESFVSCAPKDDHEAYPPEPREASAEARGVGAPGRPPLAARAEDLGITVARPPPSPRPPSAPASSNAPGTKGSAEPRADAELARAAREAVEDRPVSLPDDPRVGSISLDDDSFISCGPRSDLSAALDASRGAEPEAGRRVSFAAHGEKPGSNSSGPRSPGSAPARHSSFNKVPSKHRKDLKALWRHMGIEEGREK